MILEIVIGVSAAIFVILLNYVLNLRSEVKELKRELENVIYQISEHNQRMIRRMREVEEELDEVDQD